MRSWRKKGRKCLCGNRLYVLDIQYSTLNINEENRNLVLECRRKYWCKNCGRIYNAIEKIFHYGKFRKNTGGKNAPANT